MNLFKWFSKTKTEEQPKPQKPKTPSAGERWKDKDKDPFPPECLLVILDTKDNWVQYKYTFDLEQDGRYKGTNSRYTMSFGDFCRLFQFYDKPERSV